MKNNLRTIYLNLQILVMSLSNPTFSEAQINRETNLEFEIVLPYKGTINGVPKWLEIKYYKSDSTFLSNKIHGKMSTFNLKNNKKFVEPNQSVYEESFIIENDSMTLFSYPSNQKLSHKNGTLKGTLTKPKGKSIYYFKSITKNNNIVDYISLMIKDTLGENLYSGDTIQNQIFKTLKIYKGNKVVQEINNVNEDAYYLERNNKKFYFLKLEDFNSDNFLDIILTYSSGKKLYQTDDVIFLFDPAKNRFSSRKLYRLKNLSEAQFRKSYGPH